MSDDVKPTVKTNIDYLPIWKDGASAADRLMEVAAIAMKNPHWFSRLVIVWEEDCGESSKTRYIGTPMDSRELLGLLEQAKMECFIWTRGLLT